MQSIETIHLCFRAPFTSICASPNVFENRWHTSCSIPISIAGINSRFEWTRIKSRQTRSRQSNTQTIEETTQTFLTHSFSCSNFSFWNLCLSQRGRFLMEATKYQHEVLRTSSWVENWNKSKPSLYLHYFYWDWQMKSLGEEQGTCSRWRI